MRYIAFCAVAVASARLLPFASANTAASFAYPGPLGGLGVSLEDPTFRIIKTIDLDNDGSLDVISAAKSLEVALNDGNGFLTGTTVIPFQDLNILSSERSVDAEDLDGDGLPDILLGSTSLDTPLIGLFSNNSSSPGTFAGAERVPLIQRSTFQLISTETILTNNRVYDLAIADFDNDGFNDIVLLMGTNGIVLLRNDGDGTGRSFEATRIVTRETTGNVLVGDFDGDGFVDFVVHNFVSNAILLYRNNNNIDFREQVVDATPGVRVKMAVGDIDGDGFLDIATSGNDFIIAYFSNAGNTLLSDDQAFTKVIALDSSKPGFVTTWRSASIVDVDGDGLNDIVMTGTVAGTGLRIVKQTAVRKFQYDDSERIPGSDKFYSFCFLFDINGDGMPDLAGRSVDSVLAGRYALAVENSVTTTTTPEPTPTTPTSSGSPPTDSPPPTALSEPPSSGAVQVNFSLRACLLVASTSMMILPMLAAVW